MNRHEWKQGICRNCGQPWFCKDVFELWCILRDSLDGTRCLKLAQQRGFTPISEDRFGLLLESSEGRCMLTVHPSLHPTNISTLVYMPKGKGETVSLVVEGKLMGNFTLQKPNRVAGGN